MNCVGDRGLVTVLPIWQHKMELDDTRVWDFYLRVLKRDTTAYEVAADYTIEAKCN
jgi:hypothetical protein